MSDDRASAPVTGIVLAGGRARRFGRPKLETELGGIALIRRAVDAVAVVADEIIVALPHDPAAASALEHRLGEASGGGLPAGRLRFVRDAEANGGPLAGLAAALDAATDPVAIVVGGDMPRLSPEVLRAMLEARETRAAVQLEQDGEPRPLPAVVRVDATRSAVARGLASDEPSDRSLRSMLARLDVQVVPEAIWRAIDPDGGTLLDIDTPEDLAAAELAQ